MHDHDRIRPEAYQYTRRDGGGPDDPYPPGFDAETERFRPWYVEQNGWPSLRREVVAVVVLAAAGVLGYTFAKGAERREAACAQHPENCRPDASAHIPARHHYFGNRP